MVQMQQGDNDKSIGLGQYLRQVFRLTCSHEAFWNERQVQADDGSPVVTGACKNCGEQVTKIFPLDNAPQ